MTLRPMAKHPAVRRRVRGGAAAAAGLQLVGHVGAPRGALRPDLGGDGADLGLHPIVIAQYSLPTYYQGAYHSCFAGVTIGFIPVQTQASSSSEASAARPKTIGLRPSTVIAAVPGGHLA